jgi:hypothetical protein
LTLRSDTVSTVLLVEWQLTTDYFDGDVLNGPVPRLFAPDPAIGKAAIANNPAKAFKDVQRLYARLFISEHVIADNFVQLCVYIKEIFPDSSSAVNRFHDRHMIIYCRGRVYSVVKR